MPDIKEKIDKFKNSGQRLRKEIKERTISYIVAAFSLVAGLAWNEAVKSLIEYLFPLAQHTLLAKFVYAVLVTLFAVVITVYLAKLFEEDEEEDKNKPKDD